MSKLYEFDFQSHSMNPTNPSHFADSLSSGSGPSPQNSAQKQAPSLKHSQNSSLKKWPSTKFELLEEDFDKSFISFCEKMGQVYEINSFLLTLKAQIPKKFKTGDLFLFYQSQGLGLKRAYIRNSLFYEEKAKSPWAPVPNIQTSSKEQSLYLAKEFGRPFYKTLVIPLSFENKKNSAVLFIEIKQSDRYFDSLSLFFNKRLGFLNLIFNRALSNNSWAKIPYLWSQLFTHWWEPLALLKNFQAIRFNTAFKQNFAFVPDFLKDKKFPRLIENKKKIYKAHYYPIACFKSINLGVLYCQNLTKQFYLKEQLFQSEKMSSLCDLGKNMAHQLNNPLTGIQSMAQIFCQDPKLESFKEDFKEVEKASQRSQKIIQNLLSFSNLTGEKTTTCCLNQVVKNTLSLLKSQLTYFKLKLNFCDSLLKVKGESSALGQAFYNIILNACQALKEHNIKTPVIDISTGFYCKTQAYVKIKDNGPGIAEKHLEKIFQPFWTQKNKGTGLGLGIARQFVKKTGGDILVSSQEAEFACFTILLPFKDKPLGVKTVSLKTNPVEDSLNLKARTTDFFSGNKLATTSPKIKQTLKAKKHDSKA